MKTRDFQAILLPQQNTPLAQLARYHVYKDPTHFITVEAPTAAKALEISGMSNVSLIKREILETHSVVDIKEWSMPNDKEKPEEIPSA